MLDDLACTGTETSLFSCTHTTSHNCAHSEDVGITCQGLHEKIFCSIGHVFILLQLGALKGLFDWQTAPRTWRVVWRCATVEVGALSVTIALVHLMQMSLAGSSAFLTLVSELRFFLEARAHACMQLCESSIKSHGCFIGATFSCCAAYGQGTGDIILDDLVCTGTETSLFECGNAGIGTHNCAHSEDIGILCEGTLVVHTQI